MNQCFLCRYVSIQQGKRSKFFGSFFIGVLVASWMTRKSCLGLHNFLKKDPVKKSLYPHKAYTFPHLQKEFQKITMKIDIVGTCPNFQLYLARTLVL
jgi:hypothetical protein